MRNLRIYKNLYYLYEERYDLKNEEAFRKLNQEIVAICPNLKTVLESTYGEEQEKFNTLHLSVLEEEKISNVYQKLEDENYNFYHSLLLFTSDLCNTSYEKTEAYLINRYQRSPYIKEIKKERKDYTIVSTLGTIHFMKAPNYFNQLGKKTLEYVSKQGMFSDCCHDGAEFVTKNLEDSIAYTSLLPQAFDGTFYHSYTYHNGNIIDLNYNCVIPQEEYEKLTKPQVIQKIPHKELEEKLQPFDGMDAPLLYSALEKQRQVYQKK